jgi:hypothetical protein
MAEALDHAHWRVGIDDFNQKAVFIKTGEFPDPIGELRILFSQIPRVTFQKVLIKLLL